MLRQFPVKNSNCFFIHDKQQQTDLTLNRTTHQYSLIEIIRSMRADEFQNIVSFLQGPWTHDITNIFYRFVVIFTISHKLVMAGERGSILTRPPLPEEKRRPDEEPGHCDRLPPRLRRLLYRTVDYVTDPWHARRQASGRALRTTRARLELRHFRPGGAAALLFRLASERGNVRRLARTGAGLADQARTRHAPGPGVSAARSLKRRAQAGPFKPTKRWRRRGVREPLSW